MTHCIKPLDGRLVVLPDPVEEKSKGGILIPETHQSRQQLAQQRGTVVAIDVGAFPHMKEGKPVVGDIVYYTKYAGGTVMGSDGVNYTVLRDDDVAAIHEVSDE